MTRTTAPPVTETPTLEEVLSTWLPTGKAAKLAGIGERYMIELAATGKVRSVTTPIGRLYEPTQLVEYATRPKKRYRMAEYVAAKKEGRTIGPGDPHNIPEGVPMKQSA